MFSDVAVSQISIQTIFYVLGLSAIFGLAISYIYQKTFKGTSYSDSFAQSLVLLSVITSIVMLNIGSNLARAFGLVGALSIIRFRTAVKDPKDISFVFLSLAIGIAVGTQNYHIAAISTVVVLTLIYVLDRTRFGLFTSDNYFLTVDTSETKFNEDELILILDKACSDYSLFKVGAIFGKKNAMRRTYKLNLLTHHEHQLVQDASKLKGVVDLNLISSEGYISK